MDLVGEKHQEAPSRKETCDQSSSAIEAIPEATARNTLSSRRNDIRTIALWPTRSGGNGVECTSMVW
jgi:hypothetical protein